MKCWFGDVKDGKMILNDLGKIVDEEWNKTKEIRGKGLISRQRHQLNEII